MRSRLLGELTALPPDPLARFGRRGIKDGRIRDGERPGRKGRGGKEVEGGKGRNGNGPDQVWKEIDTPCPRALLLSRLQVFSRVTVSRDVTR